MPLPDRPVSTLGLPWRARARRQVISDSARFRTSIRHSPPTRSMPAPCLSICAFLAKLSMAGAFPSAGLGLPSVLATTRRRIKENRELVLSVVRGVVETIHLFKTRPDIAVPLLQRFMNFNERRAAE